MDKIKILTILASSICVLFAESSIEGIITFEGKAPKMKTIRMEADPICSLKHVTPVKKEYLVLGEGNTMGNIFIRVLNPPKGDFPAPEEHATLTQQGCKYSPHVMGLMVNQPLEILNPDGTMHNVHAMPKINKEFNQAMPKFKKKMVKIFTKEEFMIPFKCDVHPWMGCYVGVSSHPFFDVTNEDGAYEITGLPNGTYEIEAWHEKLGVQTATVSLGADTSAIANFLFHAPKKNE